MYDIEKGIPAPIKPVRGEYAYPFKSLEVGDSFVVELQGSTWAGYYEAVKRAQRTLNIKITSKMIAERKRRVWRVA